LTWGKHVEYFELLEKRGQRTPLRDLPRLDDELMPVWDAFTLLSNARPVGWSAGAIPATEIVAILDLYCMTDVEERLEWFTLIRAMDSAFLSHKSEEEPKKEEPAHGRRGSPTSGHRPFRGSPRRGSR
jgi:hypothetical protein